MATKSLGNVTLDYNSVSLEEHLNTASLEAVVTELETTVLSSTGAEKIPGVVNWSIPAGGPWSDTLDDALGPDAVSPPASLRTLAATIGSAGNTVTYTWTSNAFIQNYRISVEVNGILNWSGTLAVSGAPTRS